MTETSTKTKLLTYSKVKLPEIGTRVLVQATAHMRYDENNQRHKYDYFPENPVEMVVVGAVRRQVGEFIEASSGEDGYEQAQLSCTGTVLLVQCRRTRFSKIVDVDPCHLKVLR